MKKIRFLACCAMPFGLLATNSFATEPNSTTNQNGDVLAMPNVQAAVKLPVNGMTKAAVKKKFGTPLKKEAAVGEPPISVWHYANFKVFFEHDLVLHSVSDIRKPVIRP